MIGTLATRLAGSSDAFGTAPATRSVNFIAAHDGFSLADLVRYERKHNEANGEMNHDGHNENFSWNNGVEGDSSDPKIAGERQRDLKALLATLFFSRGTIMLTAGDEFGRTQQGNNNAYAQDNAISWLDWTGRDRALEDFAFALAAIRKRLAVLSDCTFLTGKPGENGLPDVEWLTEAGAPMTERDWNDPGAAAADHGARRQGWPARRRASSMATAARRLRTLPVAARVLLGKPDARCGPARWRDARRVAGRTCLCFVETRDMSRSSDWWRGGVIYQVYPRSYQDTTGDGSGDLKGITRRLGHIASLGRRCRLAVALLQVADGRHGL